MAKQNLVPIFLAIFLFNLANISQGSSASSPPGIKGGYWPSWKADQIPPQSIPTSYFTHLFYAFAEVDPTSYALNVSQLDQHWMPIFTSTLHSSSPTVKAIMSIGGAAANQTVFSLMAGEKPRRSAFIQSTIEAARRYGFDGLDLDWEFPADQKDMSKLALLFKEWRREAIQESLACGKPRLLISAAVYYTTTVSVAPTNVTRIYPGRRLGKYLDLISPMTYDYHGAWNTSLTGSHALLYDKSINLSTSYAISSWKSTGIDSRKLAMGLPLYGRSWTLSDPTQNGIGAPAVSVGPGDQGYIGYDEVLKYNLVFDATVVYDRETVSTYSYSGTTWISYDDVISMIVKIKFAKAQGLGGYFIWDLSTDYNWSLSIAASMAWDGEI